MVSHITAVEWVKAHISVKAATDLGGAEAGAKARGNDWADKAADLGRLMHEQPSKVQSRELKTTIFHATAAARVIAATLPHWPKLQRHDKRKKRVPPAGWAIEAPAQADRHSWELGRTTSLRLLSLSFLALFCICCYKHRSAQHFSLLYQRLKRRL